MASERIQRRIEALLDEADVAVSASEWRFVREKARAVLAIDASNEDAQAYLKMAEANLPLREPLPPTAPTGRFDKFTGSARVALTLAQQEAHSFNHNYIGTEHILIGLVKQGGTAATILLSLGVEPHEPQAAVQFIIGRGEPQGPGEVGLTPRAKKVVELAVDEARLLGHNYIGTEHLLVGLVREGEGIAAGVLESLGVKLERVRAEAARLAGSSPREP